LYMEEHNNSSPTGAHARSPKSGGLFAILASLAFLLPVAIVPYGVYYQGADKTIIFAILTILALLFYLVARLVDGVIVFPRSRVLLAGVILSLVYLVSAIFSTNHYNSFSGTLFDNETFWVVFLLMIIVYLASIAVKTVGRVAVIVSVLFGAGTVLFVTQVLHITLGWTFGILGGDKTSNLLGSWYNFGIFFGILLVISLAFLELAPSLRFWSKISGVFAIISAVVVYFVQLNSIWMAIIGISILMCLIKLTARFPIKSEARTGNNDRIPIFALIAIVVSLGALLYGGQGTRFANRASEIVASPIETRPGWSATADVAKGVIRSSPVLGIGPNLFSRAWVKYKPLSVNATNFWSTDFNRGAGYIPSTIVSVGILGFLAWLIFAISTLGTVFKRHTASLHSPFFYPMILGSLYVWVLAFLYIPDLTILFFGALLLGVALGIGIIDGSVNLEVISTRLFSRRKNVTIFLTVVFMLGTLSLGYLYIQKYRALSFYKEADGLTTTDLPGTTRALTKAVSIDQSDLYYRAIAQANLSMLAAAVGSQTGKLDANDKIALQQQFLAYYNDALNAANKAVAIDNSQYINWVLLGNVYESVITQGVENAYEKAKEAYNKAAVLNPTSPLVAFEPARLEAAHNNPKGALPYLERSIGLKPNYARAYSFAAQLALSTGDLTTAITASEQAVLAAPGDFSVHFQLGYLVYEAGDYERAVTELEESIKLNPQYANAKYFLGLSYDKVGRRKDAIKMFADILATNPENGEVAGILANFRAGRAALE
jgi:tetratricopeptide (TPR) repeat protein